LPCWKSGLRAIDYPRREAKILCSMPSWHVYCADRGSAGQYVREHLAGENQQRGHGRPRIPRIKPANAIRVALLGDSVAASLYTPSAEKFKSIWERSLAQAWTAGRDHEFRHRRAPAPGAVADVPSAARATFSLTLWCWRSTGATTCGNNLASRDKGPRQSAQGRVLGTPMADEASGWLPKIDPLVVEQFARLPVPRYPQGQDPNHAGLQPGAADIPKKRAVPAAAGRCT